MASPKRNTARPNLSAGILAYRRGRHGLEVLLVHPGGPYWRNKDDGAWSIPKGEIGTSEDLEQAAHREFAEELVRQRRSAPLQALGEIRQRGGKRVIAFWGHGVARYRAADAAIGTKTNIRKMTKSFFNEKCGWISGRYIVRLAARAMAAWHTKWMRLTLHHVRSDLPRNFDERAFGGSQPSGLLVEAGVTAS